METIKLNLYENRQDVTLTTYVLSDSSEMLNGKKRPAILICPGGAYLGCSDREAEPVALRFYAIQHIATAGDLLPFSVICPSIQTLFTPRRCVILVKPF
jgi:acetyl esterase/lipase